VNIQTTRTVIFSAKKTLAQLHTQGAAIRLNFIRCQEALFNPKPSKTFAFSRF
jgi:hypothetical protein